MRWTRRCAAGTRSCSSPSRTCGRRHRHHHRFPCPYRMICCSSTIIAFCTDSTRASRLCFASPPREARLSYSQAEEEELVLGGEHTHASFCIAQDCQNCLSWITRQGICCWLGHTRTMGRTKWLYILATLSERRDCSFFFFLMGVAWRYPSLVFDCVVVFFP